MSMGIVSYGLYLPDNIVEAPEMVAQSGLSLDDMTDLGFSAKHLPGPDDQPVSMARQAAAQALKKGGSVGPEDVDLLIWTGEEYKDYIAQTASIRLQEELGCRRAWAFDLVGQGVTLLLGLKVALDLMEGDDEVRTVLLAGGTRNIDLVDPTNPDTAFLLPYSASGAALLLQRDLGRNLVVKVTSSTEPDLADEVCVPGGGTETPFAIDNLDSPLMRFRVRHPEVVAGYLRESFPDRLAREVNQCCGGQRPDLLALRHLTPAQRRRVLEVLGLHPGCSPELNRQGHHGANDVVIALDIMARQDQLRDGARLALASAGIGFCYAAAQVIWGEA